MIYKPYNVYPHNSSIDANEDNTFSFIFSGDYLTYMDYHFYDVSNGEMVRHSYVSLKSQNVYNNEEKRIRFNKGTFENGKKYKYKMNLYQSKADIFVVQGTVRSIPETALSDVQIPISYGITEIESPIHYDINGTDTIFGACYIEINDGNICERRMISNYNPELKYGTGDGYGNYDYRTYITISAPFSIKPTEGTTYKIFKNYITTPEYYFECYSKPIILPVAKLNNHGNIECSSQYYQLQNIGIKNYQYTLYKSIEDSVISETTIIENENNTNTKIYVSDVGNVGYAKYVTISYTDSDNGYNISETRSISGFSLSDNYVTVSEEFSFTPSVGMNVKIFNGSMTMIAESPVVYNQSLKCEFNNIIRDIQYKLSLKVITQTNTIVENEIEGIFQSVGTNDGSREFDCYIDNDNNDIRISYNISKPALVEREDINTLDTERIVFGYQPIHDYLAASNKNYQYHIIDMIKENDEWKYGSKYTSEILSPVWCNWVIYSLEEWRNLNTDVPNKETYRVSGSWKLFINAEEGDITQNINRHVHVGYYDKPKVTVNDNNYISGTLSCDITQVSPVDSKLTDSIYKAQEWRKFITENELFLLKNPKGDVWVVSITDNPTTKYNYQNKLKQTTVSFSFTECRDIKDIAIVN